MTIITMALLCMLSFALGVLSQVIMFKQDEVGSLIVDTRNDKIRYSLEVTKIPLCELSNHDRIVFVVQPYKESTN